MQVRTRQRGLAAVEFAIVGLVLMVILFAIIEFGRIVHSLNVLEEAARRGARVAATCPVDHANVTKAALWVPMINFSAANVSTEYLDEDLKPAANYNAISYVRVTTHGYAMRLNIPLVDRDFTAPPFSSTLPRESLGVPHAGAAAAGCYPE